MVTGREKDATRVAQTLMASHWSKPLVADGRWGSYTQSAYNAMTSEVRSSVDQVLGTFGTSASRLNAAYQAEKVLDPASKQTYTAERASISAKAQEMRELIAKIAAEEGVPVRTALVIAWLESKFNPNAKSPTGAKGLFQFTRIAVKDVALRGKPPLDITGKEYDPENNARAGMRFIKLVAGDLKTSLDDVAGVYMGFNIGPSAAKLYLAGRVTDVVADAISKQAYGPPAQYGTRLRAAVQNSPYFA